VLRAAREEQAMASTLPPPLGQLLKRYRIAAHLTQEELAERAGLSARAISDIERGLHRTPYQDTVSKLADALQLSAEEHAQFAAAARRSGAQDPVPAPERTPQLETVTLLADTLDASPAAALPTGTVTFLFTDIAGSTWLLQQLGAERYAVVQADYRRLVRAAMAAHGGHEVDTQGDGFFLAFATAPDALQAAVAAQRAFAAHPWPEGASVRVRMGLHSGIAHLAGERYIGLDVHRAARIAAAGHGGQVLLSRTTRALVEADLPVELTVTDLGAHRLKDLQRPEELWQLILPDLPNLPADFPALATLDAHLHNLPIQPTALLGREREVTEVCALLRRDAVRLVTLTGPGGTGKTRLALQVAAELIEDFVDGVWFVSLSRLSDPELVIPTVAQSLGLREAGTRPIGDVLREHLRARRLLLLVDNCEQVVGAAPALAELLQVCPQVRLLATSRVALHLRGEHEYPVSPLALPASAARQPFSVERLLEAPAVALFVEQARTHRPDFTLTDATGAAVAAICARLDGLPLALGLAAARMRVLPPQQLLARMERQLPLLVGGARDVEARQQTMRNTLVWSEDLLEPAERTLFRRLAVFVGGWTLEAAEAVCAAPEGVPPLGLDVLEGLERLVDHSLVQPVDVEGAARFRLLYVVREYALEHLEVGGEVEALQGTHAAYYLGLAELAEPELHGRAQVVWLDRLEMDHDNFRAALTWARAHSQTEAERGLRLAAALESFWFARGHLREGRSWTEGLLDAVTQHQGGGTGAGGEVSPVVWARALKAASWLATFSGEDYGPTAARLEAAVAMARAAGDLRTAAAALSGLDAAAYFEGDLAQSARRQEESLALFRATGSIGGVAWTLSLQGELALLQGDLPRATSLSEEALAVARRAGHLQAEVNTLCTLGQLAQRRGDLPTALALHRQGLALARELADPRRIAYALEYLANGVGAVGHGEQAARLLGTATALREAIGSPRPAVERALNEHTVAEARAALGEETWAAAFAAGRALSVEETIAEALLETTG
jgi:predicted ATPase/class 3 adenylate cyclase